MPTSVVGLLLGEIVADAVAYEVAFGALDAGLFFGSELVVGNAVGWAAGAITSQLTGSLMKSALYGGAESSPTSPSFTAQAQQRTHLIRSAVANRQIVYGLQMVSGPLIFAASSADNNTLHLVVALAGHEIDAVEDVYFGDTLATDAQFAGYYTMATHLGAIDQVADADLVAADVGWTTAHRLQGVAYLYVKLTYSRDVFPRGIPNIKAVIRGKKLYDPRTSTTAWSQNLALAVRDYLAGRYGLSSLSAEIDDAAIIAAANICDESVTLADATTESRYTCNGVLDTGCTPRANMEALLSGGGGALTWPAGLWTLHVGAYVSPSVTLTESDLAGPIKVRARVPRQDLYNAIKGTYVDPAKYWQPGDFPPVTNSTYATQDGAQIFRDIALPVTTSSATAQRLAKIMVEKSRQGITVDLPAKLTAFQLATWDNVMLSISQLGWASKVFKVTGWQFSDAGCVTLTLQEEAAACYTWSAEETITDPAPDTNLPDPFTVETPASLTLESGADQLVYQSDGTVVSRIKASWPAPVDAMAPLAEIQSKVSTDTVWQTVARPAAAAGSLWLNPVQDGAAYDLRIRFENTLGVRGPWFQAAPHTVVGKTSPPADVTNFHLSVAGPNQGLLTWDIAADVDVVYGGQMTIRHSPALTGATWDGAFEIATAPGSATRVNVALISGTYLAKWIDSTGHNSTTAASISSNMATLMAQNVVVTQTEHPAWAGYKNNAVIDGSYLTIDTSGGTVLACGTYAVPRIDLGEAYLCRISANVPTLAYATGSLFDSRSGLIDSWQSIDGAVRDMSDVTLWVRSTPSDPSISGDWGPFQPHPVSADIYGRAFDFELRLYSYAGDQNIYAEELTITVDMPDRVETGIDVAYTSGTLAITFARPYFTVPAIGITAQSMAVGDYYTLTAKSETGFAIQFRNSGGSAVARTFDWFSTGY